MLILDSLLIGGIKFVLSKISAAVEAELSDETSLREELLAAQMQLELGELSEEEFAELEAAIFARLREIREHNLAQVEGEMRVTGVELSIEGVDTPPSGDHR